MRAACIGALATLALAALSWRALVTRYHLHRLQSDPQAFDAALAGTTSAELDRALASFVATRAGTARMAGWLLRDATRGETSALNGMNEMESLYLVCWQETDPRGCTASSTGTRVEAWGGGCAMSQNPDLDLATHRAISSLLRHASREELSLPELPGFRGHVVRWEEVLKVMPPECRGSNFDLNVDFSPLAVLLHREP